MSKYRIYIFFTLIFFSYCIQAQLPSQHIKYPGYNTAPIAPDSSGMSCTATALAARIKVGWNLGNTLEAMGGETSWGNPMVTNELIQLVKQSGFNAIRIPCSWNHYVEDTATAKIRSSWLDRVKQVVQYCVDNDMYVILNIHWDGGWLENNVTPDRQSKVNDKQRAFWEQIATQFRDFDEHLIFAGANEPNVDNAAQMAVLQTYHQTFVDAVRSTGGRNSYRVLVVQGPSTDIEKTNNLMYSLPTDKITNKMMVEIHYYTPYQFCLMPKDADWGKAFYYWGREYHSAADPDRNATWGEEAQLDGLMASMKSKFVDKGIPVILGEYAVIRRTFLTGGALELHLASRAYFLKYMTWRAKANGLLPFYWDAGNMGENASALFDRKNNKVYDQQALEAIMEGAMDPGTRQTSIQTKDSIQVRRFFSETSFWNQPLPENVEIDPQNAHFLELLKKEPNGPFFKINLVAWTVPVYEVNDSTPRYKIQLHQLTPAERKSWNTNRETFGHGKEFDAEPVPIPKGAQADPQADAHCALVDWKSRVAWDMWGLKKNADGSWTSNTGMKYSIDGEGVYNPKDFGIQDGESIHFFGPSRAAGVPAIAGLIMYDEIQKGEINHKLACATRVNAYKEHVFPAIWTDGFIVGGIPEGAVIQLDPNLDLTKFNLYPGEMAVAKALQKYGMVVTDNAAANTLYGEGLWGHPGKSWEGILREDGGGISSIPIENYRILKINNRVNRGDSYSKILNDAGRLF